MKVQSDNTVGAAFQTNKTPVGFTPITTSITFETQEEFDTFKEVCGRAYTVSNAVKRVATLPFNADAGSDLLSALFYHLEEQKS